MNHEGPFSLNIFRLSTVDIDFGDTPVVQTPIINEESKIRCNPKSKPPPQVDWLKDLLPLKSGEGRGGVV